VGLGTEHYIGTNSYWRDDQLGQTDLDFAKSQKQKYLVSGIGDGGLVDLFRLTIRDFKHEAIFHELFGSPGSALLRRLAELQTELSPEAGWLFDQLHAIEKSRDSLSTAISRLGRQLRSDTDVTLNGKQKSFRQGLTLDRISLGNALLAYCLFRLSAFQYRSGSLNKRSNGLTGVAKRKAKPAWLANAKVKIVRHGTDREAPLKEIGCSRKQIQKIRSQSNTGNPIFQAGWWGRYTHPDDAENDQGDPTPVEFVPPALMSHATTFVTTLYAGRVKKKSGLGRYFSVETGIVGLACKTGSLVVAKRQTREKFDRIWELTNLQGGGAKRVRSYVNSLFACPFFASGSRDSHERVTLVLFADSADAKLFDKEVRDIIAAACCGFVDLLEDLQASGALRPAVSFYTGFRVEKGRKRSQDQ
jgi:hypothetical protein